MLIHDGGDRPPLVAVLLRSLALHLQIADYFVDLVIDDVVQQGASRYTVDGLTRALGNDKAAGQLDRGLYQRGELP